MNLTSLSLRSFRNYESADFEFEKKVNILSGVNGIGKTNILEAIYILGSGKSFRTNKEDNIKKLDSSGYYIKGSYFGLTGTRVVERGVENKTKRITLDGKSVVRRRDIIGLFPLVLFLPGDTVLVEGEPASRRDFFNMLIATVSQNYLDKLIRYHKVLKERNALLRIHGDYKLYDEDLCSFGSELVCENRDFAMRLEDKMNDIYKTLFADKAKCSIRYDNCSYMDSKENFKQILSKKQHTDERLKTTTAGPHRAEYSLFYNEKNARAFASQGEKRLLSLVMKLGKEALISEISKESPILLIDDALLELDNSRRGDILSYLKGRGQVFVTVTEAEKISKHLSGKVYNVADYKN